MFLCGSDHIVNNLLGHKRTNGIMHQHDVVIAGRDRTYCVCDRMLAMLSAFDQMNLPLRNVRKIFHQAGSESLNLIPAQRNKNLRHFRTGHKLSQSMNEDRHASKLSELLGRRGLLAFAAGIRDHTRPQTCSRNDHNYLHSGLQVYEGEGFSSNRIAECSTPPRYGIHPIHILLKVGNSLSLRHNAAQTTEAKAHSFSKLYGTTRVNTMAVNLH